MDGGGTEPWGVNTPTCVCLGGTAVGGGGRVRARQQAVGRATGVSTGEGGPTRWVWTEWPLVTRIGQGLRYQAQARVVPRLHNGLLFPGFGSIGVQADAVIDARRCDHLDPCEVAHGGDLPGQGGVPARTMEDRGWTRGTDRLFPRPGSCCGRGQGGSRGGRQSRDRGVPVRLQTREGAVDGQLSLVSSRYEPPTAVVEAEGSDRRGCELGQLARHVPGGHSTVQVHGMVCQRLNGRTGRMKVLAGGGQTAHWRGTGGEGPRHRGAGTPIVTRRAVACGSRAGGDSWHAEGKGVCGVHVERALVRYLGSAGSVAWVGVCVSGG